MIWLEIQFKKEYIDNGKSIIEDTQHVPRQTIIITAYKQEQELLVCLLSHLLSSFTCHVLLPKPEE